MDLSRSTSRTAGPRSSTPRVEHLEITVAVGRSSAWSSPSRWRCSRAGSPRLESTILGVTTGIYTIPSLALFPLLVPFTGLSPTTVVIGLALYALTILVRSMLEGLRSVPDEVRESATGLGLRRRAGCCSGSSCRWRCR